MNIENIHIGDHVVITGWKGDCYDYDRREVYGAPARVVGICVPYLAIKPIGDERVVRTVDTRIWNLTKCDAEYAQAFTGFVPQSQPEGKIQQNTFHRDSCCPVCNEGRFVKVYATGKEPQWQCLVCDSKIVEGGSGKTQRIV